MSARTTTVTVSGVLVREPEIRYTPKGIAETRLRITPHEGEPDPRADEAVEVVAYRDLAENIALSLTKGMSVVVVGQLGPPTSDRVSSLIAMDLGPSLVDATADVRRVERRP